MEHTFPDWAYLVVNIYWLILLIVNNHFARKHGIWDGVFNQFLPDVKKAILEYRPNYKFNDSAEE